MSSSSEEGQTHRSTLPDCAAESDSRALPIQEVGISGLSYPISVWDRSGKLQHTVAEIQLAVGLPSHFKGTHMSRFLEVLNAHGNVVHVENIPNILTAMQEKLDSQTAHLEMDFPFFLEKVAPLKNKIQNFLCLFFF